MLNYYKFVGLVQIFVEVERLNEDESGFFFGSPVERLWISLCLNTPGNFCPLKVRVCSGVLGGPRFCSLKCWCYITWNTWRLPGGRSNTSLQHEGLWPWCLFLQIWPPSEASDVWFHLRCSTAWWVPVSAGPLSGPPCLWSWSLCSVLVTSFCLCVSVLLSPGLLQICHWVCGPG